jgi:hypothetical protein
MRRKPLALTALLVCPGLLTAQTAAELVAKNLEARGGIAQIKAIKTLRMKGKVQFGGFMAKLERSAMAPNLLRETMTIQGMSQIQAYDGSSGWKISPFQGRKDPELMGEQEQRDIVEEADFYGPLVDYATKDNRIEYLGHDTVDGDDAYRLKVTLANGDILYYYLDPDTYLEIRREKMEFVQGAVRETVANLGSYKKVAGVYFPFSIEAGGLHDDPNSFAKVTIDTMEVNVPVDSSEFKMPATASGAATAKQPGKGIN